MIRFFAKIIELASDLHEFDNCAVFRKVPKETEPLFFLIMSCFLSLDPSPKLEVRLQPNQVGITVYSLVWIDPVV